MKVFIILNRNYIYSASSFPFEVFISRAMSAGASDLAPDACSILRSMGVVLNPKTSSCLQFCDMHLLIDVLICAADRCFDIVVKQDQHVCTYILYIYI